MKKGSILQRDDFCVWWATVYCELFWSAWKKKVFIVIELLCIQNYRVGCFQVVLYVQIAWRIMIAQCRICSYYCGGINAAIKQQTYKLP